MRPYHRRLPIAHTGLLVRRAARKVDPRANTVAYDAAVTAPALGIDCDGRTDGRTTFLVEFRSSPSSSTAGRSTARLPVGRAVREVRNAGSDFENCPRTGGSQKHEDSSERVRSDEPTTETISRTRTSLTSLHGQVHSSQVQIKLRRIEIN